MPARSVKRLRLNVFRGCPFVVGRGKDCELVYEYPDVCKYHCQFEVAWDGDTPCVVLFDTSANGTWLQEGNKWHQLRQEVAYRVFPGDVISLLDPRSRLSQHHELLLESVGQAGVSSAGG